MDMSGINRDEAILDKLDCALDHLQDVQAMMEGHVICGQHWPLAGKLLSEIERTISNIELVVAGRL